MAPPKKHKADQLTALSSKLSSLLNSPNSANTLEQLVPAVQQLLALFNDHPDNPHASHPKDNPGFDWSALLQTGLKFLPELLALL